MKSPWPIRFLRLFCPPQLLEEIEGDLLQKFERDAIRFNATKAKRKLLWNVVRYFRLGIVLRNKFVSELNATHMLRNYFKTSLRHILKNKINFTFRLGGLTLALFSFIAIAIYVSFQFSFDTFHANYKNIYRVNSLRKENGREKRYATVPSALGPAMKAELPEIKNYCIVSEWGPALMRVNDQVHRSSFIEADSSIFSVFTFEFLKGDKKALQKPNGLVLTQSLAKQLFVDQEPLYQIVSFPDRNNTLLEVRAVIKDLPDNSSISAKGIITYGALRDNQEQKEINQWSFAYGGNLFVLLDEHAHIREVTSKAQALVDNNLPKPVDGVGKSLSVVLQPLSEIYWSKPWRFEFDRKGNAVYVYMFISLAAFLLLIASINYLNLSVADFSFRMKEMGVRKVMGARKSQIISQIFIETTLTCLLALTLSVGLLYWAFDQITQIFDSSLRFSMLFKPGLLVLLLAICLLVIFISSAYPAYRLSLNHPIANMKRQQNFVGKFSINQILLLLQFSIGAFCLGTTQVIGNQLHYIQTKDIGLDRQNLLTILMPDRYPEAKAAALKDEFSKLSGVESTSFSYYYATGTPYFNSWYKVEVGSEMKPILLNEMFVDEDYLKTMHIELAEGRNFQNKSEYKTSFIVNETAAKEFGWTNAIGKRIVVGVESQGDGVWSEGNVIGVVKDFNTRSLHKSIEPIVMRLQYDSWPGTCLHVRYKGTESEILVQIKETYEKVLPGFLMDFERANERYNNQYKDDQKVYSTLQTTTWIILLISCIGFFSISIFMFIKRQREFGIRKVVGATVSQITSLHISHFLKIALAANSFALPLAYWASQWWLNNFVYRTELSAFGFLICGLVLLLMVIISSGFSAWKAGNTNPIDVIKTE